MPHALLISVRFHDGRYHGAGPWPPAPARLFQALVAGAAEGGVIPPVAHKALAWLETLDPPIIAAPSARAGRSYKSYVPNNDLDAKRGDPGRLAEIRVPKQIRPRLFDADAPLLYLWHFENDPEGHARAIAELTERLYQFGRGVDMAWATGEILDAEEAEKRVKAHSGAIYRPAERGIGKLFACPTHRSLASLIDRHENMGARFSALMVKSPTKKDPERMKVAGQTFSQPPKPRFAQVAYNSPAERRLYDLRDLSAKAAFHAWPLPEAARLVEMVRDKAAARLRKAYEEAGRQDRTASVERVFIGRDATEADKPARIRILPLPSIGFHHTDSSIRRILLEIPPDCPLPRADIAWTFAGLRLVEKIDPETGEISQDVRLVEADDRRMLRHYGIESQGPARLWRSVTPAALPERATRRRIDPARMRDEAKGAPERAEEERQACQAVRAALRHAGIETPPASIHVQREPLAVKGARAEAFAPGTRFSKHRLWHVEVAFTEPRAGPMVIGDGRYLGLGLMAPDRDALRDHMVFALSPESPVAAADAPALLYAIRRALMALSRDGEGKVPRLFSGHEADGAPARSNRHEHIFLAADEANNDGLIDRLIVAAPWSCDRTMHPPHPKRALFDRVVSELRHVRAGRLGVIVLDRPSALPPRDPLAGPAQVWESRTTYRPTRHASRGKDPATAVEQDAIMECERRGLPRPDVALLALDSGPSGGNVAARLRLSFAIAVQGPLMLGRDSHMGGGLFAVVDE